MNNAVYEVRPFVMPQKNKHYSIFEIEGLICIASGLDRFELRGKTRLRKIVMWRQLFYLICRSYDYTTLSIGAFLRFDHATVIHGAIAAKKQLETDPVYRQLLIEKLPPALWAKIKPKNIIR